MLYLSFRGQCEVVQSARVVVSARTIAIAMRRFQLEAAWQHDVPWVGSPGASLSGPPFGAIVADTIPLDQRGMCVMIQGERHPPVHPPADSGHFMLVGSHI